MITLFVGFVLFMGVLGIKEKKEYLEQNTFQGWQGKQVECQIANFDRGQIDIYNIVTGTVLGLIGTGASQEFMLSPAWIYNVREKYGSDFTNHSIPVIACARLDNEKDQEKRKHNFNILLDYYKTH